MLGRLSSSLRRSSKSKRGSTSRPQKSTPSSSSPKKPRPYSSHNDDANGHLNPPASNSRRRARSHEAERRRPDRDDNDDYHRPSHPPRTDTRRRSPSPPPRRREPTLRDARRLRRRSTRDGSISADEDSRPLSPGGSTSPRYPADRTSRRGRDRPAYPEMHSGRPNSKQYPPDSYTQRPVFDRRRMSYDSSYAMRPGATAVAFKSISPQGHRPLNHSQPDFPRSSPRSRSREDARRSRHPDAMSSARPSPTTERPPAERQPARKPKPKPRPKPPAEPSTKSSSDGDFWDHLPRVFATFTGLKVLTDHVDTAKEWADWLSDLQGAPEEIHALSAKATTAKDTIYQIQHSLEARPDLVEGESGQMLKQQIETAIKSTDASLEEMTKLLQEVGDDGTKGGVWKGLQDFYSSYQYKNEWEGKIREAEAKLQKDLATLSTLMVNIYSRALMKPAPPGSTLNVPPPSSFPIKINIEAPSSVAGNDEKLSTPAVETKSLPHIQELPTEADSSVTAKDASPDKTESKADSKEDKQSQPRPPSPSDIAKEEAKIGTQDKKSDQTSPTSTPDAPAPDTKKQDEAKPSPDTETSSPRAPSPDAVTHDNHQVALLDAAWTGDLTAAARELEHVSPMTRDLQGLTPLHLAVERDHLATAMLLRDHHIDCNARDDNGRTPLHLAARFASAATVEFLMEKCRCDPNSRNVDGRTPLHYAATVAVDGDEERRDVLRVLRDWDADPTVADNKGRTPRDLAQQRDCWDAAATLRRAEKAWEKKRDRRTSWMQRHGFKRA